MPCPALSGATFSQDVRDILEKGLEHHNAGRLQEAVVAYTRVLDADPLCGDAYNLSGLIALARGNASIAEKLIAKAVKLMPMHALFQFNLGVVQLIKGQPGKAINSFNCSLKLKPDAIDTWLTLGAAEVERGSLAAAASALRKATMVAPGRFDAWKNLGLILARQDQIAEAREALQRALALQPDDAEVRGSLDDMKDASIIHGRGAAEGGLSTAPRDAL